MVVCQSARLLVVILYIVRNTEATRAFPVLSSTLTRPGPSWSVLARPHPSWRSAPASLGRRRAEASGRQEAHPGRARGTPLPLL